MSTTLKTLLSLGLFYLVAIYLMSLWDGCTMLSSAQELVHVGWNTFIKPWLILIGLGTIIYFIIKLKNK